MKLLKKNQLIILVITLMFITVGYLSYENDNNTADTQVSSSINDITFGDATLVSGNLVENAESDVEDLEDDESQTAINANENTTATETNNQGETNTSSVSTNSSLNNFEDYFVSSRLQRDAMYSQMIEAYQRILDNKDIADEQRTSAGDEINKINNTRNAIMISENLIKNRDVQDVVIFVNDNSVNVVLRTDNPSNDLIAQIQNIVTRELEAALENIHISNK